jgi:hypothetical protein
MLVNPIKYMFSKKYSLKEEINKIEINQDCKKFVEKYLEVVDDDIVNNLAILAISTQTDRSIQDVTVIFKSLKYEDMLVDFEKLLKDKDLLSKQQNENPFIKNIIEKKNLKPDNTKIINTFLPFLKENKECAMYFFNKIVSINLTNESLEKNMKELENINHESSITDYSTLKCDDPSKEKDDCDNGSYCSKGFNCVVKEKGTGSKYLCSPFVNPVKCNDARFSCPSDSKCIDRQKCKHSNNKITNQVMNSDAYFEEIEPTEIVSKKTKPKESVTKKTELPVKVSYTQKTEPSFQQSIQKHTDTIILKKPININREIHDKNTNISKSESTDSDSPNTKHFPHLKNRLSKYQHNPSYTRPIVDCKINKHDFYKSQNICPDCK